MIDRKFLAVVFVLLMAVAVSQAQDQQQKAAAGAKAKSGKTTTDKGPTLDETMNWLKQTLAAEGAGYEIYTESGTGFAGRDNYSMATSIQNFEGCNITLQQVYKINSHVDIANGPTTDHGFVQNYVIKLNFADLDPSSIHARQKPPMTGSAENTWVRVSAPTILLELKASNDAKKIAYSTTATQDNVTGPKSESTASSLTIWLANEELAGKVSKALSRAISLCGGKASLF
jgi:hypothetical protein